MLLNLLFTIFLFIFHVLKKNGSECLQNMNLWKNWSCFLCPLCLSHNLWSQSGLQNTSTQKPLHRYRIYLVSKALLSKLSLCSKACNLIAGQQKTAQPVICYKNKARFNKSEIKRSYPIWDFKDIETEWIWEYRDSKELAVLSMDREISMSNMFFN